MSNILDDIVESFGGYDKLNSEELKTYEEHLKILEGKTLSVADIKTFVRMMIGNLERALVDAREGSAESKGMKCRLKNFLMLEQFLFAPDRAREALQTYYKSVK